MGSYAVFSVVSCQYDAYMHFSMNQDSIEEHNYLQIDGSDCYACGFSLQI